MSRKVIKTVFLAIISSVKLASALGSIPNPSLGTISASIGSEFVADFSSQFNPALSGDAALYAIDGSVPSFSSYGSWIGFTAPATISGTPQQGSASIRLFIRGTDTSGALVQRDALLLIDGNYPPLPRAGSAGGANGITYADCTGSNPPTAYVNNTYRFKIDEDIFYDAEGATLTWSARMSPDTVSWLKFDPEAKVFFGTPDALVPVIAITLIATDPQGAQAWIRFDINVSTDKPSSASSSSSLNAGVIVAILIGSIIGVIFLVGIAVLARRRYRKYREEQDLARRRSVNSNADKRLSQVKFLQELDPGSNNGMSSSEKRKSIVEQDYLEMSYAAPGSSNGADVTFSPLNPSGSRREPTSFQATMATGFNSAVDTINRMTTRLGNWWNPENAQSSEPTVQPIEKDEKYNNMEMGISHQETEVQNRQEPEHIHPVDNVQGPSFEALTALTPPLAIVKSDDSHQQPLTFSDSDSVEDDYSDTELDFRRGSIAGSTATSGFESLLADYSRESADRRSDSDKDHDESRGESHDPHDETFAYEDRESKPMMPVSRSVGSKLSKNMRKSKKAMKPFKKMMKKMKSKDDLHLHQQHQTRQPLSPDLRPRPMSMSYSSPNLRLFTADMDMGSEINVSQENAPLRRSTDAPNKELVREPSRAAGTEHSRPRWQNKTHTYLPGLATDPSRLEAGGSDSPITPPPSRPPSSLTLIRRMEAELDDVIRRAQQNYGRQDNRSVPVRDF